MIRVDVVIPCYNYSRYLRESVESVLTQADVIVRVLVIDDCSTDDSEVIGRRLAQEDSRVEFRHHARNRGHIATYNEGLLGWAEADYCLSLSADDLLMPQALARATALLEAFPNMTFCHGRAIRGDVWRPWDALRPQSNTYHVSAGIDFIRLLCISGVNKVETPTAIVRTAAQRLAGGYEPLLPHSGDLEMWLRLAALGDVGHIDAEQAFYRVHNDNMSGHYFAGIGDLEQRWAAFESFFERYGKDVQDAPRLRSRAAWEIALAAFWSASDRFDRGDRVQARAFLDLSAKVWPGIVGTSEWRRFRFRRRIGRRSTAIARYVRDRLRSRSGHATAVTSGQ